MTLAALSPADGPSTQFAKVNALIAALNSTSAQAIAVANQATALDAKINAVATVSGSPAVVTSLIRPGDGPDAFTQSMSGGASQVFPVFPAVFTAFGDAGAVARVVGATAVASRRDVAIEPNRTYGARFVVQRRSNASDPSNDTVRLGLLWMDQGKNAVGISVVKDFLTLNVANGRQEVSTTYARTASANVQIVAPGNAVYVRLFVQTFGTDPVTDVEVIEGNDLSNATLLDTVSADALSRIASLESIGAGPAIATLQSQIGNPLMLTFTSVGNAASATVANQVTSIRTLGYHTSGDLGGALYTRAASQPTMPGRFKTADGAWWQLAEPIINVMMLGAMGDGVTDDGPAFQAAHDCLPATGGFVFVPQPSVAYNIATTSTLTKTVRFWGTGFGCPLSVQTVTAFDAQAADCEFHDLYAYGNRSTATTNRFVHLSTGSPGLKVIGCRLEMLNTAVHVEGGYGHIFERLRLRNMVVCSLLLDKSTAGVNGNDAFIRNLIHDTDTAQYAEPTAVVWCKDFDALDMSDFDLIHGGGAAGLYINPQGAGGSSNHVIGLGYFDTTSGAGVQISPASGSFVTRTFFEGSWFSTCGVGMLIDGAGQVTGVAVNGNFHHCLKQAILTNNTNPNTRGLIVKDSCTFCANSASSNGQFPTIELDGYMNNFYIGGIFNWHAMGWDGYGYKPAYHIVFGSTMSAMTGTIAGQFDTNVTVAWFGALPANVVVQANPPQIVSIAGSYENDLTTASQAIANVGFTPTGRSCFATASCWIDAEEGGANRVQAFMRIVDGSGNQLGAGATVIVSTTDGAAVSLTCTISLTSLVPGQAYSAQLMMVKTTATGPIIPRGTQVTITTL